MAGRNQRTHYDFTLGSAIATLDHQQLLRIASSHLHLAQLALKEGARFQASARIVAAEEAILEARLRGDQLRLRI